MTTTRFSVLIDISGSMGARFGDTEETRDFCILDLSKLLLLSLVKSIPNNNILDVYTFERNIDNICTNITLNEQTKELVCDMINKDGVIRPKTITNMFAAFQHAVANIHQNGAADNNVILLMTDGIPSDVNVKIFENKLVQLVEKTHVEFSLYSFGIGIGSDSFFLHNLTERFGGSNVFISDIGTASDMFIHRLTNILKPKSELASEKLQNISKLFVSHIDTIITLIQNRKCDLALETIQVLQTELRNFLPSDTVDVYTKELFTAINPEYINKWSLHFLRSLKTAHSRFECHSFIDPSVSIYIELYPEDWSTTRDTIEEIYMKIPTPKPCLPQYNSMTTVYTLNLQSYASATTCVHELSTVIMADNSTKNSKDIQVGDQVKVVGGKQDVDEVQYIIKSGTKNMNHMVQLQTGLIVTDWHPIKIANQYVFPNDCIAQGIATHTENVGDYKYSFVLKNRSPNMIINGTEVITLAHGCVEDCAKHDFWGTEKVVDEIKDHIGPFDCGVLQMKCPVAKFDENNCVIGFVDKTSYCNVQ